MSKFNPNTWPAEQRQWVYRCGIAAVGILVLYKVLPTEHAPAWLDLLAEILGLGGAGTAAATADRTLRQQRHDGTLD